MTKRAWELPGDVLAVRSEIETWRSNRTNKREPIPIGLWTSAAQLARRYSVYRISRALRLNYVKLRRLMEGLSKANTKTLNKEVLDVGGSKFVEVCGVEMMSGVEREPTVGVGVIGESPGLEIEVSESGGVRMTLRLSSVTGVDLLGLVSSIWRGKR